MDDATIKTITDQIKPELREPARLNFKVEALLEELRAANATEPLKSRELSLAITNIEQGSHWLSVLIARLDG